MQVIEKRVWGINKIKVVAEGVAGAKVVIQFFQLSLPGFDCFACLQSIQS
jgi:hypothetical protein